MTAKERLHELVEKAENLTHEIVNEIEALFHAKNAIPVAQPAPETTEAPAAPATAEAPTATAEASVDAPAPEAAPTPAETAPESNN